MTNILTKVLEKIIKDRREETFIECISPFQGASNKNRRTFNNALYLKEPVQIIFYYFKQCFDSLWLNDRFLTLWKAGINDELFYFFYLLNKNVKITIFTTFENIEEIQTEDIVE